MSYVVIFGVKYKYSNNSDTDLLKILSGTLQTAV